MGCGSMLDVQGSRLNVERSGFEVEHCALNSSACLPRVERSDG